MMPSLISQDIKSPEELKSKILSWIIGITALVLFALSSFKHVIFRSDAWDLGIYDQAIYLISQGKPPISSILGIHILGDHASLIFYPLSLLYKIYPDVHWLLAVQAVGLALGAWPVWGLACQAGLKHKEAIVIAVAYLAYPAIWGANLFDFHPEVLAVPALLWAVWAARLGKTIWFVLAIIVVLSCKEVLSLTVVALGIWLFLFEKKRLYGAIALFAGVGWYVISTKVIIPFFSTYVAGDFTGEFTIGYLNGLSRYEYLGKSPLEIVKNLFFRPDLVLNQVISFRNFKYLALLALPVIWGLSPWHLSPLIGALPTLGLNLLSSNSGQQLINNQYSLPIVPFLFLTIISTLAANRGLLRYRRIIILWVLIILLLILTKNLLNIINFEYSPFNWGNWQATQTAIKKIPSQAGVFTTNEIVPHLSHRSLISNYHLIGDLDKFDYVLLNLKNPHFISDFPKNDSYFPNSDSFTSFVNRVKNHPRLQLIYKQNQVYLFEKSSK